MDRYLYDNLDTKRTQSLAYLTDKVKKYPTLKKYWDTYGKWITLAVVCASAIYAFHLSWKCSSFGDSGVPSRLASASIAATLNVMYIVYYYLSKTDQCFIMKRLNQIAHVKKQGWLYPKFW